MSRSKKTALLILAVISVISSRAMFMFLDDPEGPNLLVVMVMAAIVYSLSLLAYFFGPSGSVLKRLLSTISIQIVIVIGFYFLLN